MHPIIIQAVARERVRDHRVRAMTARRARQVRGRRHRVAAPAIVGSARAAGGPRPGPYVPAQELS